MKIHEQTILSDERDGSFALPTLPEEIADIYCAMRVHVRVDDCPMWWRRDGGDAGDESTSYRIAAGQTRSIEEPDQFPLARFRFDGAGSLTVVWEGRKIGEWLESRPELTAEEFVAPIKAANGGAEQMRVNNGRTCVDAVLGTNPGEPFYSPQTAGELARTAAEDAEVRAWSGTEDPGRAQALTKVKAAQAAVGQSWERK